VAAAQAEKAADWIRGERPIVAARCSATLPERRSPAVLTTIGFVLVGVHLIVAHWRRV
jgi:hypothetical protein